MKRFYRLNFDTLIIQYNAAFKKVQRLQDLVTHARTEELGILGGIDILTFFKISVIQ